MTIPISLISLETLSDLRVQPPQSKQMIQLLGLNTVTDGNGGTYLWNDTSTATDDGFLVVQVTGVTTGRWLRLGNGNTNKGTSTFNGTGFVSAFTVTHGLGFTPAQVYVQARTANAAANWVTSITSTQFTVNFSTIPLLGTGNIVFDWLLIKQ